jgi:S1-C subfamily serine protease
MAIAVSLFLAAAVTTTRAASESLQQLVGEGASRVLGIYSADGRLGVATTVTEDGYLVTKHSDLARVEGFLEVKVGRRYIQPRVVDVLPEVDLLVLKIPGKALPSVTWEADARSAEMGQWLVSMGAAAEEAALGVVSARTRQIAAKKAALGIELMNSERDPTAQGVTIARVFPASPAERCGLLPRDILLVVHGKEVSSPRDVIAAITALPPGGVLELEIARAGRRLRKTASLSDTSILEAPFDFGRYLNGRTSLRNVDFPEVIQHDTAIDPALLGGALVDLEGRLVGINIARVNRFTTFALPVRTFGKALEAVIEADRASRRGLGVSLLSPAGPVGSAKSRP